MGVLDCAILGRGMALEVFRCAAGDGRFGEVRSRWRGVLLGEVVFAAGVGVSDCALGLALGGVARRWTNRHLLWFGVAILACLLGIWISAAALRGAALVRATFCMAPTWWRFA